MIARYLVCLCEKHFNLIRRSIHTDDSNKTGTSITFLIAITVAYFTEKVFSSEYLSMGVKTTIFGNNFISFAKLCIINS